MAKDCETLGKAHSWRQVPVKYSQHSSQIVGWEWKCDACAKTSEDKPPDAK